MICSLERFNSYLLKQEKESGILELEDDPKLVRAMLRHLYKLDYAKDIGDTDKVDIPKMVFDARVYATADKYDIPSLKILAMANFEKKAKTWETATDFSLSIKVIY